jgi:predicted lipase
MEYTIKTNQSNFQVIVAFRGTQPTSLKNWITDLDAAKLVKFFSPLHSPPKTPYRNIAGAEVHEGFYGAYMTVAPQVEAAVSELVRLYPNFPIYVTGHSLGAALSVLSAIDIQVTFNVDVTNYNYGGKLRRILFFSTSDPRVGNQVFAQYYDSTVTTTYRVVNEADIVPHVPPRWLSKFVNTIRC